MSDSECVMRITSPAERRVIDAALEAHAHAGGEAHIAYAAIEKLSAACADLKKARAPKGPPTPRERVEQLLTAKDGSFGWQNANGLDVERHIREAESIAWDRAIEAVEAKAAKWDEGTHRGSYAWIGYVTALKGKCHEVSA